MPYATLRHNPFETKIYWGSSVPGHVENSIAQLFYRTNGTKKEWPGLTEVSGKYLPRHHEVLTLLEATGWEIKYVSPCGNTGGQEYVFQLPTHTSSLVVGSGVAPVSTAPPSQAPQQVQQPQPQGMQQPQYVEQQQQVNNMQQQPQQMQQQQVNNNMQQPQYVEQQQVNNNMQQPQMQQPQGSNMQQQPMQQQVGPGPMQPQQQQHSSQQDAPGPQRLSGGNNNHVVVGNSSQHFQGPM